MKLTVERDDLEYLMGLYPELPKYEISTIANSGTFLSTHHGVKIEFR